jgi:hypothetical protein
LSLRDLASRLVPRERIHAMDDGEIMLADGAAIGAHCVVLAKGGRIRSERLHVQHQFLSFQRVAAS